jgi:type VI secretion system Hcp family effector
MKQPEGDRSSRARVSTARLLSGFLAVLVMGPAAGSWAGTFMNVPGIPGEATFPPAAGQIDVLSVGWDVSHTKAVGAACGGRTGKLDFSGFCITKHVDKASPKLFVAAAQGTVFPTVTLSLFKAADVTPYTQYNLTNALVASVQTGSGTDPDRPTESVCFNFAAIATSVTPADPADPPVVSGWNVCTATAF